MRFTIKNNKLIPTLLLKSTQQSTIISYIENPPQPPINTQFPFNPKLQQILTGKQLLLEDIPFSLQEIQEHYENGYIKYRKSIVIDKDKYRCERCGNAEQEFFAFFPCARCGERCCYCRKCLMMGRLSTCTPLISWTGSEPVINEKSSLEWSGTLSDGQRVASERAVDSAKANESLLIWAVCGAGKTEVLFESINESLKAGKRVCIATPRTDVVLELAPRLKKVFPSISVAALYGGSEDRHTFSPLTISTTHQLLRFYKAFDVIILDEVDAFPYSVDNTLQHAVEQARKETSSIIYLTATPNQMWQKECLSGKRPYITIPARFHRYSLPVPQFVWCGDWQKKLKKGTMPSNVLNWIKKRIQANKQALLFFPRIELMDLFLPILKTLHPNIESVHAEDPKRKEKVQAMRDKEIPMLLTTTILERGVTFPHLDVAVIGAEDRVFTESALVQIAGRVGRSSEFPSGDITFFHYGKTNAMVKARKQILKMNKEAQLKGLIDE